MKERDISLDIIRIIACFMVVLMHSPVPSEKASGPFLAALSYFTAPCIGLFFMASGALLLPVKTDYVSFIKKRFSKILVPTLLWSIIYVIVNLYHSESEINILQRFASLPFSPQGEGVLWFMYTLSGLYLLAPILSAWLEKASQRELQIVLSLWCITLCYPILDCCVILNTTTSGILYYFTGYAGYFLLGYYLRKYPESISSFFAWTLAAAGAGLLLFLKYLNVQFDFYSLFWYESIFIAAMAVAIWKAVYKIGVANISSFGIKVSKLTFGIYLSHILIMRHWLWHLDWINEIPNYPLQSIVIALLTFALSILLCRVLSKLPYSRWIIGYNGYRDNGADRH